MMYFVAVLACLFLFVFWLLVSRRLLGLIYALAGVATIALVAQDPRPAHIASVLLVVVVLAVLALALRGLVVARKRRIPVYIPPEYRRRPGQAVRSFHRDAPETAQGYEHAHSAYTKRQRVPSRPHVPARASREPEQEYTVSQRPASRQRRGA